MEKYETHSPWSAPARAVKQEKWKEKTCKQIQESITKNLSGLGAAIKQKDWNLSWLIDLSKVECCWNSSFEQLLETPWE